MIEKKIYYVWIGNAKKPDIFYKCLKSWQEKLPDYEIVEINEKNFDIEAHLKENCGHICLTTSEFITCMKIREYM